MAHYLDPVRQKGINPWPNAATECRYYYKQALEMLRRKKIGSAFFFVGAALHLVQDLCVPHHAMAIPFRGHQNFERWVLKNRYDFAIDCGGIYDKNIQDPAQWVFNNARKAREYKEVIDCENTSYYRESALKLYSMAQSTTSGFLYWFCQNNLA